MYSLSPGVRVRISPGHAHSTIQLGVWAPRDPVRLTHKIYHCKTARSFLPLSSKMLMSLQVFPFMEMEKNHPTYDIQPSKGRSAEIAMST